MQYIYICDESPDDIRQGLQRSHNLFPHCCLGSRVLTQGKCHHGDGHNLAGVGLCGSHPNLKTSIDVDAAVGVSGNGRADCVGYADTQSTLLLGIAQCLQCVKSLHQTCHVASREGGGGTHTTGFGVGGGQGKRLITEATLHSIYKFSCRVSYTP